MRYPNYRIIQLLLLFCFFASIALNVQAQRERPYAPITWSDQDSVSLPVAWYAPIFDSLAQATGQDGYYSLLIQPFRRRRNQAIFGDTMYNIVLRPNALTRGFYVESRNALTGTLHWNTTVDTTGIGNAFAHLEMRLQTDTLQVLTVQDVRKSTKFQPFPFEVGSDSSKVVVLGIDTKTGNLIQRLESPDEQAQIIGQSTFSTGLNGYQTFFAGDTVRHYFSDRRVPFQAVRKDLTLDGRLVAQDTIPLSVRNRVTLFDMQPLRDEDAYLIFDYSPDSIYIQKVDPDFNVLLSSHAIPVVNRESFTYFTLMQDGNILIEETYNGLYILHLYDPDLNHISTVTPPQEVFCEVFSYEGKPYVVCNQGTPPEYALVMYEWSADSLIKLYEWHAQDRRTFVPRQITQKDNLIYLQGVESSISIFDPNRIDEGAQAVSTIVLDVSQLDKLVSSSQGVLANDDHYLNIYPNPPIMEEIWIDLGHSDHIRIYDIWGRMYYQSLEARDRHMVKLTGYPAGLYVVRSNNGLRGKFVISQ